VDSFLVSADALWAPDLFGVDRSALRASVAALKADTANLGALQVSIAAEVALNYIVLRSAQSRLAIATDNLASQQDTLQITSWREQAGLLPALSTEQARAVAEQTAALLPTFQASIEQARHALAVLTGRPPAALDMLLATVVALPEAPDVQAPGIPADTLRQRADVRSAELQVIAAQARLTQAQAARWPTLTLSGSLASVGTGVGALGESASLVRTLLASIGVPLLDGGAARARVRSQRAALLLAEATYEAAVLGALQDVEDALSQARNDRSRRTSLGHAVAAATSAAALARDQFASGLVDFQTVLDTQRTQLTTQDSLAVATAAVSSDQVRLFQSLGGGWRDPDTALARVNPGAASNSP
jgi:NodT family efflux transporter outer membrane factor (OMF) lipoprotein